MTIRGPEDIGVRPGALSRLIGGIFGSSRSRLTRPHGIAVRDGVIYVVDREQGRIHCFDPENRRHWTLPRKRDAIFLSPIDIAIDPEGDVYVTDSRLGAIFRFDPGGEWKGTIRFSELKRPTGIAWDPDRRRLYVADTVGHRIHVLDADGARLFSFGERGSTPGRLNFPVGLALDADGSLLVNDAMNFRIQRFDPEGHLLGVFGRAGDRPGSFSKPKGIAVDGEGRIFVVDALFGTVQIFDPSGRVLLVFGGSGTGPGEFSLPTGIAVDGRDRVYVCDSYNARVEVFQIIGEEGERG
jgi:sugar lactone lactonase YvrE